MSSVQLSAFIHSAEEQRREPSLTFEGASAPRDVGTFTHLSTPKGFPLLQAKRKHCQPPPYLQTVQGDEGRGLVPAEAAAICVSVGKLRREHADVSWRPLPESGWA